jgi:hypothetical protein
VTNDGGDHWQRLAAPCVADFRPLLTVLDRSHLWLLCGTQPDTGGQAARLYRTGDGGTTWQLMSDNTGPWMGNGPPAKGNMPTTGYEWNLAAFPDGTLLTSRAKFGMIARSTVGGTHWVTLLGVDGSGGYELTTLNDRVFWAASIACLYGTIDGGAHWTLRNALPKSRCSVTPPQT